MLDPAQASTGQLAAAFVHDCNHLVCSPYTRAALCVQWTSPLQLHGIGQYAADAYWMFCRGQWRQVDPADKDLRKYHDWLTETDGQGSGLQREPCSPDQQLQRLAGEAHVTDAATCG